LRLGLDTARVVLEFDASSDADRERIAQLYRFARILRHVSSDSRVSIEAELPRRLLSRFHLPADAQRAGVSAEAPRAKAESLP
jgi:hypothetical protein